MINLDAIPWKGTQFQGVSLHFYESDRESGYAALLIRMEPGCSYPAHRHNGPEQILVLQGSFADENGVYECGQFVRFPEGSRHHPRCPDDGDTCVLFAIASEGIDLLGEVP